MNKLINSQNLFEAISVKKDMQRLTEDVKLEKLRNAQKQQKKEINTMLDLINCHRKETTFFINENLKKWQKYCNYESLRNYFVFVKTQ